MTLTRKSLPRRTRIAPLSEKQKAKREAAGETFIASTVSRRSSPPRKNAKPIPKRNAKRRRSEFTRAYGSKERVAWVKRQPCIVQHPDCAGQPVENAHVITGGMGRKADARWVAPICHLHHRELHRIGTTSFEAKYRSHLRHAARRTDLEWDQFVGTGALSDWRLTGANQ